MSKTKKVIVVSNAFLISAGIENLVLELSGMLVDHVYNGSEKKLCDKILSRKPEFVIIPALFLKINKVSFSIV